MCSVTEPTCLYHSGLNSHQNHLSCQQTDPLTPPSHRAERAALFYRSLFHTAIYKENRIKVVTAPRLTTPPTSDHAPYPAPSGACPEAGREAGPPSAAQRRGWGRGRGRGRSRRRRRHGLRGLGRRVPAGVGGAAGRLPAHPGTGHPGTLRGPSPRPPGSWPRLHQGSPEAPRGRS